MEVKIDYEYQHAKRFKRKYINFLPFVIFEPSNFVTKRYLEENDKEDFDILNSKFIKKNYPTEKYILSASIYMYIGFFLFLAFFPYFYEHVLGNDPISDFKKHVWFGLGSIFLIPAIYLFVKKQKSPNKKHILFDRENTIITMPKRNEREYFSLPFTHLKATIRIEVDGSYELDFFNDPRIPLPWRNEYLNMSLSNLFPKASDYWYFYVWYMDKNRPLPPGSAFDEFREADFERRKTEGFPPPLFKSAMPTPEATAEQQLVREAFWQDKDYIATQDEAFFSFWKSKPKNSKTLPKFR